MKIFWGTSNMFKISYSVVVLAIIILCKETYLKMFYGERTNDYPKSSCLDIGKFQSTGRCLAVCGTTLEMLIMISHNMETHTCMCCDDITGSDIIGSNWKTYIPRKWKLNDYFFSFLNIIKAASPFFCSITNSKNGGKSLCNAVRRVCFHLYKMIFSTMWRPLCYIRLVLIPNVFEVYWCQCHVSFSCRKLSSGKKQCY